MIKLEEYMLPCLSKRIFGIDCPGCGLQRSTLAMLKGEFTDAFIFYPGIYPLIALVAVMIISQFVKIKYGPKLISALAILSVATILINYIIKITT